MTIKEAKEKIEAEFGSIFTKDEVMSLLSALDNNSIKNQNDNVITEKEAISTNREIEIRNPECREIKVKKHDNIHIIVSSEENLPNPCKFIIQNSQEPYQTVYPGDENDGWRIIEAVDVNQGIYKYFSETDKLYSNQKNSNFSSRYLIIQEEMRKKGIEEICLIICPIKYG